MGWLGCGRGGGSGGTLLKTSLPTGLALSWAALWPQVPGAVGHIRPGVWRLLPTLSNTRLLGHGTTRNCISTQGLELDPVFLPHLNVYFWDKGTYTKR